MNASPLLLERYFFTHVAIVAHPEPGAKNSNEVETTVEVGQGVEDGRRYQVIVRLKLMPPQKGAAAYTGEIHAVGFFKVAPAWPKDSAKRAQVLEFADTPTPRANFMQARLNVMIGALKGIGGYLGRKE